MRNRFATIAFALAVLVVGLVGTSAYAERRTDVHQTGPIRKFVLFDGAAPGSNADIISSVAANGVGSLTPTYDGSMFVVQATFATGTVLNYTVGPEGAQAGTVAYTPAARGLNSSTALGAGDAYQFSVGPVVAGREYNFQIETDSVITELTVWEVVAETH